MADVKSLFSSLLPPQGEGWDGDRVCKACHIDSLTASMSCNTSSVRLKLLSLDYLIGPNAKVGIPVNLRVIAPLLFWCYSAVLN